MVYFLLPCLLKSHAANWWQLLEAVDVIQLIPRGPDYFLYLAGRRSNVGILDKESHYSPPLGIHFDETLNLATSMEEENWGCPILEEDTQALLPGNVEGSSTTRPSPSKQLIHLVVPTEEPGPKYLSNPTRRTLGLPHH
jgi:hypothetical protein